ncbi:10092_t:CDS:2 [Acaulospora colombiana]|uniref:10092_t:CDS:1 n=1 Tax=Acaulospora colombiana TaxID=27376 RepID=A0ACA9KD45_9GLOM|nr:10092_t:CDS:2 [Acaulospora colombiana]
MKNKKPKINCKIRVRGKVQVRPSCECPIRFYQRPEFVQVRIKNDVSIKESLTGAITKDRRFEDASNQFTELAKTTEKFHNDVIKFRDSMSNMINHQTNVSDLLLELYNPIQGDGPSEGGVTRRVKTPARSMKAVEIYAEIMSEIRDLILPELDDIDQKIVEPAVEFMKIIKAIKKVITKRDHKKVDYDRYNLSLKKLQDKKDRSLNDEKQMFKLEEQFDQATQEYEYYNDLLKKELPLFFEFRVEFIEPIAESFYHIQLKIFGILLERFEQLVEIGYFDTETDIVRGFESRREEATNMLDELTIIDRRKRDTSSIRSRSPNYRTSSSRRDYEEECEDEDYDVPPPEYTPVTIPRPKREPPEYNPRSKKESPELSHKPVVTSPKPKKPPPPPIAPKPKLAHYVIALYDYDAQAEGDLSFRKDDKIEVIERTPDVNDWWKGKLKGKIGMFPVEFAAKDHYTTCRHVKCPPNKCCRDMARIISGHQKVKEMKRQAKVEDESCTLDDSYKEVDSGKDYKNGNDK